MSEKGEGDKMKWLVFSDSHGYIDGMRRAIELEKPDRVLHLGDVVRDGVKLLSACPGLELEQVRGNCDPVDNGPPEERELFFGLHRVWMLHGHTYWVKSGINLLADEARTRGVEVALFGHTHKPLCTRQGALWIMNPGTAGGRPTVTYGVIEEREGELYCRTAVVE